MDGNSIMNNITQYGIIVIFLIIFLENLNMPGFPAGVIMPIVGLWASKHNENIIFIMILSVIASLLASWILYFIGFYGGNYILDKYTKRFPKQSEYIDEKLEYLRRKGNVGVMISRMIPMARTIIPVPAGVLKLNFLKYTAYSAIGILIWDSTLICSGYILGDGVIKILS